MEIATLYTTAITIWVSWPLRAAIPRQSCATISPIIPSALAIEVVLVGKGVVTIDPAAESCALIKGLAVRRLSPTRRESLSVPLALAPSRPSALRLPSSLRFPPLRTCRSPLSLGVLTPGTSSRFPTSLRTCRRSLTTPSIPTLRTTMRLPSSLRISTPLRPCRVPIAATILASSLRRISSTLWSRSWPSFIRTRTAKTLERLTTQAAAMALATLYALFTSPLAPIAMADLLTAAMAKTLAALHAAATSVQMLRALYTAITNPTCATTSAAMPIRTTM